MPDHTQNAGRYDVSSPLVDFIYGITFEIWEEKGVELIRRYYGNDVEMFALSGVTRGVESVVQGTYDTLAAFPDRLLLPENVIWSEDSDGDYSSHRILSPMTNTGASAYGPATHKQVHVRTVADCFVQDAKITREWLVRDTLPIVQQLGFSPLDAARDVARQRDIATQEWITAELKRVPSQVDVDHEWSGFARRVLSALWQSGELADVFPHYAVQYPHPVNVISGRDALAVHAAQQRASFADACLCVDHICVQPWARQGHELAVRWTLKARHNGSYLGVEATDRDVFILGASHWRVVNGQVLTDWTVFDGIGVLAQLV